MLRSIDVNGEKRRLYQSPPLVAQFAVGAATRSAPAYAGARRVVCAAASVVSTMTNAVSTRLDFFRAHPRLLGAARLCHETTSVERRKRNERAQLGGALETERPCEVEKTLVVVHVVLFENCDEVVRDVG